MVEYVEYLASREGDRDRGLDCEIRWERNSQDARLLVQARC